MATPMQLSSLRLHARLCKALNAGGTNPATPSTLKLRNELGTTTTVGLNYHYEGGDPFASLPATTDIQVWCVWEPEKVRSTSADGGDVIVGRERGQRARGQMPTVDVNGDSYTINDEDWIVSPDGVTLFRIENPIPDPTNSVYYFSMIAQQ